MTDQVPDRAAAVDFTVASPARIYDYWLGGKDNFDVDRAAARDVIDVLPDIRKLARANRRFLVRAVRYLAGLGVSQFIDLGTGIPTSPNVHEAARAVLPGARVVYVDNDPVVTVHSQALRATTPGVIAISGDIRRPQDILADRGLLEVIDFAEPVAVLFVAVLHFIRPAEDPGGIVAAFRQRMAPGSYVVISHGVSDGTGPETIARIAGAYSQASAPAIARTVTEVRALFDGFGLIEPGLADASSWRPERRTKAAGFRIAAGVGRVADT